VNTMSAPVARPIRTAIRAIVVCRYPVIVAARPAPHPMCGATATLT
ncbi:MAG: hypothetical protein QOG74_2282, partial [Alphaproteobacteria bacterium]|nr:hypothetical protein [Alphaproteobacteria bacterium]